MSQNLVLIADTSNSIYPFKELYTQAVGNIVKDYQTNFPEGILSFITFNEGATAILKPWTNSTLGEKLGRCFRSIN